MKFLRMFILAVVIFFFFAIVSFCEANDELPSDSPVDIVVEECDDEDVATDDDMTDIPEETKEEKKERPTTGDLITIAREGIDISKAKDSDSRTGEIIGAVKILVPIFKKF